VTGRGRRAAAFAVLLAGLAVSARAHWVPPEAILAELNADAQRQRTGVERAVRDAAVPRLLVVRVGERWYKRPADVRRIEVGEWRETWRHTVAQGVVSVLDAATDRPVVRFGPGGAVIDVAPGPPR
jgi:hypothetical protein